MVKINKIKPIIGFLPIIIGLNLYSCATLHEQVGKDYKNQTFVEINDSIKHRFVLIGDAGNADHKNSSELLNQIKNTFSEYDKNSTLLFLGDNIYQKGMPDKKSEERKIAEKKLDAQIDLAKNFPGKTYFIAGNHDWYSGLKGLTEQKDYVVKALGKNSFLPKEYESIKSIDIDDDLQLVFIDSEWFLQNWNHHFNINKGSDIQTREDFFEEFRSLLNKGQNKITLVIMHHPIVSNGIHGGYYSFQSHLAPIKKFPLPILGTIINYGLKTSGASPADLQNKTYTEFTNRLKTIAKNQENVIFVSGHDHNLQYIDDDGIKQIISGSASKTEPAKAKQKKSFTIGELGYGVLNVYKNDAVSLDFYTKKESSLTNVFQQKIIEPTVYNKTFDTNFQDSIKASVYTKKETEKSGLYRFLWGNHYRKVFGTEVEVKVANLDTLYGGLTPIISGGGNQSLSLRLEDKNGKQYVMRGLKKSSTQFLQSALFKNNYISDQVQDTKILNFIDDFYTTSHPYFPFVIGHLADAVNVHHTNPQLFYVPKQNALGKYNETYGDQLYQIEERPHKSFTDAKNFGNPTDIIGTQEMLLNLQKDEKYSIDKEMYLQARVFDWLIGDWDRHSDQWRWGEHEKNGQIIYEPIPRDRDQVFARIDGNLLSLLNRLPALRHMQNYKSDFPKARWATKSAFPLDRYLLQNTSKEEWQKIAQYTIDAITEDKVKEMFALLPKEVQDYQQKEIIETLEARKSKLVEFVGKYYDELLKYGLIVGTNKKDQFDVEIKKDQIIVNQYRNKKSGNELEATYTYDPKITKELWIYSLDDDDILNVSGDKSKIMIRLIGGRNNDTYTIDSKNKVKIFDYGTKKNEVKKGSNTDLILKDQYAINHFDYREAPLNTLTTLPNLGYNPDNGLMLGFSTNYKKQKFVYTPFSQQHKLSALYSFATSGVNLAYEGRFKNYTNNWHWAIEAGMSNENYAQNFFGWGNKTENLFKDDLKEMDYYRVRTSQVYFKPSYNYWGRNGGKFSIGLAYEGTQINKTNDRLIDEYIATGNENNHYQNFGGIFAQYHFKNFNDAAYPTLGLEFKLNYTFRANLKEFEENHQYIENFLNFIVPIDSNQKLTFSSAYYTKFMIGNAYHFYQAADLGANNLLRGYRQNRFVGDKSFVTSNDLRWKISRIHGGFVPVSFGVFGGYDLGRVWLDGENSSKWHQSYGGGLWLNALDALSVQLGLFTGKEKTMFNFGFGFQL